MLRCVQRSCSLNTKSIQRTAWEVLTRRVWWDRGVGLAPPGCRVALLRRDAVVQTAMVDQQRDRQHGDIGADQYLRAEREVGRVGGELDLDGRRHPAGGSQDVAGRKRLHLQHSKGSAS
eukprot:scaffold87307_cov26-Prasinocladus_malaysianus.AAC.2